MKQNSVPPEAKKTDSSAKPKSSGWWDVKVDLPPEILRAKHANSVTVPIPAKEPTIVRNAMEFDAAGNISARERVKETIENPQSDATSGNGTRLHQNPEHASGYTLDTTPSQGYSLDTIAKTKEMLPESAKPYAARLVLDVARKPNDYISQIRGEDMGNEFERKMDELDKRLAGFRQSRKHMYLEELTAKDSKEKIDVLLREYEDAIGGGKETIRLLGHNKQRTVFETILSLLTMEFHCSKTHEELNGYYNQYWKYFDIFKKYAPKVIEEFREKRILTRFYNNYENRVAELSGDYKGGIHYY